MERTENLSRGQRLLIGLKKTAFWSSSVIWFPVNFALGVAFAPLGAVFWGIYNARRIYRNSRIANDSKLLTASKCAGSFLIFFLFSAIANPLFFSPDETIKRAIGYAEPIGTNRKAYIGFFGIVFGPLIELFDNMKKMFSHFNYSKTKTETKTTAIPKAYNRNDNGTNNRNSEIGNQSVQGGNSLTQGISQTTPEINEAPNMASKQKQNQILG